MKKMMSLLIVFLLTICTAVPAAAQKTTHDNNKSSYEDYAGKGHLTYTATSVFSFDDMSLINSSSNGKISTDLKKEGNGALEVSFPNGSNKNVITAFETTDRAFEFSVSDRKKETVKFWMYINDIDLCPCDHDAVYNYPQKGSATVYIDFSKNSWDRYKYSLQHTFYGSGWHLFEVSFATHNILYETLSNLDLSKVGYMRVRCAAEPGLKLVFDDLQKYTYQNEGYETPELSENNARWISTCDYDALDGPVISEWYASSFDLEEKTQGSSSLTLTAHKEHVDTRCVWGGLDIPIYKQYDTFHFDIYISDLDLIGSDFQVRLSQSEGGKGEAHYNFGYGLLSKFANNSTGLKIGWNTVEIPIMLMTSNIDTSYYKNGCDFRLEHVVMFWAGSSEKENYTVKYDNMYVYTNPIYSEEVKQLEEERKAREESKNKKNNSSYKGMTLRESSVPEDSTQNQNIILISVIICASLLVAAGVTTAFVIIKRKKSEKTENSGTENETSVSKEENPEKEAEK